MSTRTEGIILPSYPDLAGKVAVVTGGSGGIGAATCRLLAANGAKVVVNGRDGAKIDALVDEIDSAGGQAIGVAADVTDFAAIPRSSSSGHACVKPLVEGPQPPPRVGTTFAQCISLP
jgi:3-oxoacyl-[acyl-carrier protein] reductase